jgi:hypothetical protein
MYRDSWYRLRKGVEMPVHGPEEEQYGELEEAQIPSATVVHADIHRTLVALS